MREHPLPQREGLPVLLWAVAWSLISAMIRGAAGENSFWLPLAQVLLLAAALFYIQRNHLKIKYGLAGNPPGLRWRALFVPMLILMTGNLWGGIRAAYAGPGLFWAALSMLLTGLMEEILFRGFLFTAIRERHGAEQGVIFSALAFGLCHLAGLLAGQLLADSILQAIFAMGCGAVFAVVLHQCESLWPCIIAHGLVNLFSLFAVENRTARLIYVAATMITAFFYCLYLHRQKTAEDV